MSKKQTTELRIFELAKEIDADSKDIMSYLKKQGKEVNHHFNKLDPDEVKDVRNHFSGKSSSTKSKKKTKAKSKSKSKGSSSSATATKTKEKSTKKKKKADKKEKAPVKATKTKDKKEDSKKSKKDEKGKKKSDKDKKKSKKDEKGKKKSDKDKKKPIKDDKKEKEKEKEKKKPVVVIPRRKPTRKIKVKSAVNNIHQGSHRSDSGYKPDSHHHRRGRRHRGHRRKSKSPPQKTVRPKHVVIEEPVTLRSLSEATGIKVSELIAMFMKNEMMYNINSVLPEESFLFVEEHFGTTVEVKEQKDYEDRLEEQLQLDEENPEKLVRKPPVVTFVGHVDHGKTSLLDKIRKANVQEGEAGGITQHIGAYAVDKGDQSITFIDTPGHEAFTEMRARGVKITDIVVLVVAADDGVMPQTKEAISHAKAAEVPIIVAINKVDKPESNPDNVRQQLTQHELLWEQWGGDTFMVEVSAITGFGIDNLLDHILEIADLHEFEADPTGDAVGTVIEAKKDEQRGASATVIITRGTLKVGDLAVCGETMGKIRAMYDHNGKEVEKCTPGGAVEVIGLNEVPSGGDKFVIVDDMSMARGVSEKRRQKKRETARFSRERVNLENLFSHINQGKIKELRLIVKADAQGSIEALREKLLEVEHEEVRVNILHSAVGGITTSDIHLADASDAIIIGFHVTPDSEAVSLANDKSVEIRTYQVIYKIVEEITSALEGMLEPELREVETARIEVRATFKAGKVGTIAGCYVKSGKVHRNDKIRVVRNGIVIYDSNIESLKRFKDDAKEVNEKFECGIKVENFNDIKVGDELITYRIEKIARSLS